MSVHLSMGGQKEVPASLCVCELVYALDLSQPKISRHLKLLRDSGLVTDRRERIWVHYRIAPDLPGWVDAVIQATIESNANETPFASDAKRLSAMPDRPDGRCPEFPPDPINMNILYVCTGNSCRSQIAEGWTRHLGGDHVSVRSAGLEAHGLNPNAVATMRAVGIDISNQPSSILDDADRAWADVGVTVCGHADEHCPVLPPGTRKVHCPFEDPARLVGNAHEIENAFAATRDAMRDQVEQLLSEPTSHIGLMASRPPYSGRCPKFMD